MVDKNRTCVRQIGLMQDSDGDTLSCSTNTSRWSSPLTLCCGCDDSQHDSSNFEDKTDRTPDVQPSVVWQRQMHIGFKIGKQKTNHTGLKLPAVRPLPSVQPDGMTCIMGLKCQVRDLQLQLTQARTENKLLKRIQHRHMVALQHFQDSEDSISQIRVKHDNETKALQTVLHQTRTSRDDLARQLQATENKLHISKAALQHLQLLHQDQSLLKREELSLKLTKVSAELEDKDKRIQDLERNLELCQASFMRQLVTEQRKLKEARKISCYLEKNIYQLTRDVQDRERELEKHNIYYHRYLKGLSKKGRENKKVQTNDSLFTPKCALDFLETEYCESKEKLQQQEHSVDSCCNKQGQEFLVTEEPERTVSADVLLEENLQEDETSTENSSENSYLEESPKECPGQHTVDGGATESEAADILQKLELQETEDESHLSPNKTKPQQKEDKLQKIRCNLTFSQPFENLHNGRPAYSQAEASPASCTKTM